MMSSSSVLGRYCAALFWFLLMGWGMGCRTHDHIGDAKDTAVSHLQGAKDPEEMSLVDGVAYQGPEGVYKELIMNTAVVLVLNTSSRRAVLMNRAVVSGSWPVVFPASEPVPGIYALDQAAHCPTGESEDANNIAPCHDDQPLGHYQISFLFLQGSGDKYAAQINKNTVSTESHFLRLHGSSTQLSAKWKSLEHAEMTSQTGGVQFSNQHIRRVFDPIICLDTQADYCYGYYGRFWEQADTLSPLVVNFDSSTSVRVIVDSFPSDDQVGCVYFRSHSGCDP